MTTHDGLRVRTRGEVDDTAVAQVLARLDAACERAGVPVAEGTVTVARARTRQARRPWSVTAVLLLGGSVVVVHAAAATAHQAASRMEDQILARAAHGRTDTPPPWRTDTRT